MIDLFAGFPQPNRAERRDIHRGYSQKWKGLECVPYAVESRLLTWREAAQLLRLESYLFKAEAKTLE